MRDYMQEHITKLKRSINKTESGTNYRYDYITTGDELKDAFLRSRNNLGYPLRMQARYKDDRFIYTGDALEKDLEEALTQAMKGMEQQLRDAIIHDIFPDIEASLNAIKVVNNQFVIPTTHMRSSSGSNFAKRLGQLLGRELVKTTMAIMTNKVKRKRR